MAVMAGKVELLARGVLSSRGERVGSLTGCCMVRQDSCTGHDWSPPRGAEKEQTKLCDYQGSKKILGVIGGNILTAAATQLSLS